MTYYIVGTFILIQATILPTVFALLASLKMSDVVTFLEKENRKQELLLLQREGDYQVDLAEQHLKILELQQRITDTIQQSEVEKHRIRTGTKSQIKGTVLETLFPHSDLCHYDPRDMHFLGSPIDYLVFDGLAAGHLKQIVLIEIKSGASKMTSRQSNIKRLIEEGSVSFSQVRILNHTWRETNDEDQEHSGREPGAIESES